MQKKIEENNEVCFVAEDDEDYDEDINEPLDEYMFKHYLGMMSSFSNALLYKDK